MRVYSGLAEVPAGTPAVLTIGFFDGPHRGHLAIIHRVRALANELRIAAGLVTFWPYPAVVLRPEEPVRLLATLDEKLDLLRTLGELDFVVVMPFTTALAGLGPDAYLGQLRERITLRGLVEGADFRFGRDRAGDVAWLRRAGAAAGFVVEALEVEAGGERISSTRVRSLVAAGAVAEAADLLGRPYTLAGAVIHGDARGRTLGFPTANLRLDPIRLLPGNGIYAVRAGLPGEPVAARPSVASVGVRPTIAEGGARLVEVHLLDADLDLYGQRLEAAFVAWLRDERRFPDLETLTARMKVDAAEARALLGSEESG